jgi:hypothetical protein
MSSSTTEFKFKIPFTSQVIGTKTSVKENFDVVDWDKLTDAQ